MSERWSRYESVIDEQIRKAQERGDFDNLPGKGKPLPGLDGPDDDLWWVRGYIRREGLSGDALLPPSLQLRKEIERLDDSVRELTAERAVRDTVSELNRRIAEWLRAPVGPAVPIGPVNADDVVARWLAARSVRRAGVPPPAAAAPTEPESPVGRRPWWRRRTRRTP
ncbi:MAG: hypothetical protein QOI50_4008 [Pseudonocardiales bacterium]|nr:hypothetical protein [Pseudonocardiales bacterium]MDT7566221.1 hypothetical protein [Pseudonocardiales bacterium]MDT7609645.1 hypothetical protein [Pseudonocardiales bacterium]MDT7632078.1 hypothetical protein [Pseudonocardiales bacterium]MDT7655591.1 hypothetical protein [Pseudonocardiales bacterium]